VLSAGYRPSGGILFLETLPQDRVRLGWELYGQAPVYSGPFAWDYGQPHELTVFAGFLLPPADASLWVRGSTPESRRSAKRGFVCLLDGQKVWSLDLETPEVAPASVLVGRNGIQQAGVADALNATEVSERRAKW